MRFDVLTLFPEMFAGVLGSSILKRAAQPPSDCPDSPADDPLVTYHLTDIRDYTDDKHGKVDQRPFGGGPGMVMQCQPIWDAVQAVQEQDLRPATRIVMTPQGRKLDQRLVESLATHSRLLIIAGHYEGIDARVIEKLAPITEISIGDYVLSGGELAAMVLIDAVVRLLPGVLGDDESAHYESFSPGSNRLLDHPHYTRPRVWQGMAVPEVLISGDHESIRAWREQQSRQRTSQRRPDLAVFLNRSDVAMPSVRRWINYRTGMRPPPGWTISMRFLAKSQWKVWAVRALGRLSSWIRVSRPGRALSSTT